MDLTIDEHRVHGATVVRLYGELGVDSAPLLHSALAGLTDRSVTRIVIDLAGLRFCDSIGLSAFVCAHTRCRAAGGYLRFAAASPFLHRVLSVVGLLGTVACYDTVPAACAADATRLTVSAASARPSTAPVQFGAMAPHTADRVTMR
jgi:anti-sigma B factor antagonist